jgi:hypothetical protein
MKPIKLISESDLSYFMKPKTVDDVESHMNSLILIRKHIDMDSGVSKKYFVRLYDNPSDNSTTYKVSSNAIGLEAIRNIVNKHKIFDGGSESDSSTYISFYYE